MEKYIPFDDHVEEFSWIKELFPKYNLNCSKEHNGALNLFETYNMTLSKKIEEPLFVICFKCNRQICTHIGKKRIDWYMDIYHQNELRIILGQFLIMTSFLICFECFLKELNEFCDKFEIPYLNHLKRKYLPEYNRMQKIIHFTKKNRKIKREESAKKIQFFFTEIKFRYGSKYFKSNLVPHFYSYYNV